MSPVRVFGFWLLLLLDGSAEQQLGAGPGVVKTEVSRDWRTSEAGRGAIAGVVALGQRRAGLSPAR
jgi:hypothetical protein